MSAHESVKKVDKSVSDQSSRELADQVAVVSRLSRRKRLIDSKEIFISDALFCQMIFVQE